MISPILTYNSEIWGVYVKPDFKSWDSSQIEKTHLQFCKRYLEVSNKAPNMACRAELGRFPLNIAINQKIIKTESIRKLSNFNFQWTKTLYQGNLKYIAFFFTFFESYGYNLLSVITPKTISYGSPRKQISNFT